MSNNLFILTGPPGSGKTHFAEQFVKTYGYRHINSDQTRMKYFENPVFTPEERTAVYLKMRELAEEILANGVSVIFDGNLVTNKDRRAELEYFQGKAKVYFLYFDSDRDTALVRATTRKKTEDKLYKPMDKDRAKAMHDKFETLDPELPGIIVDGDLLFNDQVGTITKTVSI